MDDLISRQAIMKEFANFVRASNNSDFARTPTWNDAVSLVESMPSAQPQRKRGRWINHLGLPLNDFCSVCTKDSPCNKHWNYCPHCGARMKGEDNE